MFMARYVVHVRSPKTPAEAFAYMTDLTNFVEWDPAVERADQVQGEGPGADAAFDVAVKGIGRSITLRYRITSYEPPHTFVARAQSRMLTSLDTITVRGDEVGTVVTYDAVLKLKGLLGLVDPLLGLTFNKIGDRAAQGLVAALEGERVEAAAP